MRKNLFAVLMLSALSLLPACRAAKAVRADGDVENLIIYYDPSVGNDALLKAADNYGSRVIYVYKNINGVAVTVPKKRSVGDAMKFYERQPGVLSVTKDEKVQLQ